MTNLRQRLDRAAGSAARRLLAWATRRHKSSDGTWIQALNAEVDQMPTGWAQLAWALGVLPVMLVERTIRVGRTWRPRLLWLASAGGVGGLRVYGPGVVCGIAMAAWNYLYPGDDVPDPLVAALLFAPFYVVRGLLAARRRTVWVGAAIGAVTAVVGFEIAVLSFAADYYTHVTESVFQSAALLVLFSLAFLILVAFVGAMCGLVGAAFAHPRTAARSLRSR